MKKLILSVLFFALFLNQAMAGENQPIPQGNLTLTRACDLALEKNPGILQARERINGAKAVLVQANSAWKPSISATGHFNAYDATTQPDWAQTQRGSESFNEYSAGIAMSWLAFNGFAREADILASKYGIEQSEQSYQDTQRLLIRSVSLTYYQAQIAIENMIIARQNRDFNRTLEKDAKLKYQIGAVPEADMLNFSVRVLKAETDYLAAQQDFDITCTALAQLMAVDGARLSPKMLPQRSRLQINHMTPEFEIEIAFARENRPDLKALDKNILALNEKYRGAKGNYYPRVYLVSGVDYLYQDEKLVVDEEEHTSYLGINFQWDIYTGGKRAGKTSEIYADIQTLKQRRKETLQSMEAEIREAILRAKTAWETWKHQRKTLEMTQTIRGSIEMAYKVGKSPLTRLNEAQTDFVNAAGAEAASRIQYLISLVNLDAAAGRLQGVSEW
ncbi:MAG: TolC family protein [Proteobacteria bacterium]|nr:TolC family protein [Pseudomonadota bacterium]